MIKWTPLEGVRLHGFIDYILLHQDGYTLTQTHGTNHKDLSNCTHYSPVYRKYDDKDIFFLEMRDGTKRELMKALNMEQDHAQTHTA